MLNRKKKHDIKNIYIICTRVRKINHIYHMTFIGVTSHNEDEKPHEMGHNKRG
jgi:hypothetical protein